MNYDVSIVDLRHRITIQKLETIRSLDGYEEEKWLNYKIVWSSKNNLYGKEFWSAKALNQENTVEFVVRYAKWISEINTVEHRINHEDKKYNIIDINNIKYENKWIKIKAIEVS